MVGRGEGTDCRGKCGARRDGVAGCSPSRCPAVTDLRLAESRPRGPCSQWRPRLCHGRGCRTLAARRPSQSMPVRCRSSRSRRARLPFGSTMVLMLHWLRGSSGHSRPLGDLSDRSCSGDGCGPTRRLPKGIDGLAAIVKQELGSDPYSGVVYVFRARRADRIKMIFWDGTGIVLISKRLCVDFR